MRRVIFYILLLCLGLGFSGWGYGRIKIVTSYTYIADIAHKMGGEAVEVEALAPGNRDPHFITPRPSFIAKLRKADLLIINGGHLEIGWLPPVIQQANNGHINPGGPGFISLIDYVQPIEVQQEVSRAHGDVHPEGNPHIQLDPDHILIFARVIKEKLCALAPAECQVFQLNYDAFAQKWQEKTQGWDQALKRLQGAKVVQYHKLYDYFLHRYQIQEVETLEPLPGIPPTSRHIVEVIESIKKNQVKFILQDVYHSPKTAQYAADKTGARVVILPHDVGAVDGVNDVFDLFDEIVRRVVGND